MKRYLLVAVLTFIALKGWSQLTPLKSVYFKNPYLLNPAMAGKEEKTRVFLNYSSQWNKIEGSPKLMSLSANRAITEKAAVGINVFSDKAGLLQRMQAMGSFAYKLPISDEQSVRFGLSIAWASEKLSLGKATRANDVALSNYNDDRKAFVDGSAGFAYINNALEFQFSYLNLNQKRAQQLSTVDYSTFYSAVSYEFNKENSLTVKPLVAYRGVKGYKNQWDVAAECNYNKMVSLYTMYHSNQSFSGGIGYDHEDIVNVSLIYNSEPNKVKGFTGGIMDIMVGFNF